MYLHSRLFLNDIMVRCRKREEKRRDADCLIEHMIDFYKHKLVEILSKKGSLYPHTRCSYIMFYAQ
jgi:hypothetical protein